MGRVFDKTFIFYDYDFVFSLDAPWIVTSTNEYKPKYIRYMFPWFTDSMLAAFAQDFNNIKINVLTLLDDCMIDGSRPWGPIKYFIRCPWYMMHKEIAIYMLF